MSFEDILKKISEKNYNLTDLTILHPERSKEKYYARKKS